MYKIALLYWKSDTFPQQSLKLRNLYAWLHTYASDILNIYEVVYQKMTSDTQPIWGLMLMIIRSTWTKFR